MFSFDFLKDIDLMLKISRIYEDGFQGCLGTRLFQSTGPPMQSTGPPIRMQGWEPVLKGGIQQIDKKGH